MGHQHTRSRCDKRTARRQAVLFSRLATARARGVTQRSVQGQERVDLDNHEASAPCRGRSSGRVPGPGCFAS
eukprot:2594309-Alexandrium_andersonii.AAC.1